jgi:hypothetical protein
MGSGAIVLGVQPSTSAPTDTAPAGGQVIEGIAVNHLGAGIAGAVVRIEGLDAGEDDAPLATTTTGQTGDIRIVLPRRIEASVRARVVKEGFALLPRKYTYDESQPPWIDATLEGAAVLTGAVHDRLFGEPVKGAIVTCQTGGQSFSVTTDAEGRYRFNTSLWAGRHPGDRQGFGVEQRSIRLLSNETEEDFDLGPERKIELRFVTDDEKPAADVRVEGVPLPMNGYVTTSTGPDGKVTLGGIPEGAETLILRLNGPRYIQMRGFDVRVDLAPESTGDKDRPPPASMPAVRRELVVHVAAKLRGTITDAKTGEPIVGVRVIAVREFRSDAHHAWSSLDGSYELPGLPPGVNVHFLPARRVCHGHRRGSPRHGADGHQDVRMEAGQVLAGKVVVASGEPVEQVFRHGRRMERAVRRWA